MRLAEFIASVAEADDPDQALLDRTLAEARERSPELADAIELCAIPRRFDAEIVGVLRGRPLDTEGNERLVAELLDYAFVRPRENGGFVYADRVREPILAQWRSPERRLRFEELTRRLVRHFEELHSVARRAEEDAALVGWIVQRASESRYRQLATALEAGLLTPLLEAVHQLALLSPAAVLEFLGRWLPAYEDLGRYRACRTLVSATDDVLARMPDDPGTLSVRRWLCYWDGRQLVRMERAAEAERVLAPLLDAEQDDRLLRLRTLGELGQAQRIQFKLSEAVASFEAEVRLGIESAADPESVPDAYLRLGGARLLLEQPDAARECYREAVAAAETLGDPAPKVLALTAVAKASLQHGDRAEALETGLEALDLARSHLRDQRAPHDALSELFAAWSVDDPALLDTTFAEGDGLLAGLRDPIPLVRRRVERIRLLRQSDQLDRAGRNVERLVPQVDRLGSPLVQAELAWEVGLLRELQGRLDEAVERLTEAEHAAERARRPGLATHARHDRGRVRARMGRWDEAAADFADAERRWREHGHERLAVLAGAQRAAAARDGGVEAHRLIADATKVLAGAGSELRGRFAAQGGEHHATFGRWVSARAAWRDAAALSASRGRLGEQARAHAELARIATAESRWGEAAHEARLAATAWEGLARRGAYVRSPERRQADHRNADGVRWLLSDDPSALVAARERLQEAVDIVPEPWYRLNQSYAAAAAGDWEDAVDALTRAMEEDARLRCPALERRLAQYHVSRGEALLEGAQYDAAGEAFADSLDRLGPEHADARLRCLLGLGDSRRWSGHEHAAAAAYRDAEAAGHLEGALRIAMLEAAGGTHEEATRACRRALASPEEEVSVEAAVLLISLLDDAAPAERRAVADAVVSAAGPSAALALGDRLLGHDHVDVAEYAFSLAEPRVPAAAMRLGKLRAERGDVVGARAYYERAAADADAALAAQAAAALGSLLAEAGDSAGAIAALRRAVARLGVDGASVAALRLGELLVQTGPQAEAEELLRPLAASGAAGVAPRALLSLGDLLAAGGRSGAAQDAHRQALAAADPDVSADAGLRLLDAQPPDTPHRGEIIDAVLDAGAGAALELGDRLAARGDRAEAEHVLRRAAELEDDHNAPEAALRLGDLLLAAGEPEGARAAYRRALDSEHVTAAPVAALRLVDELGEPRAATIDRVIALGGRAALRLARLLGRRGEREAATAALRRLAATPQDLFAPDAAIELGDLLAARGDAGGARAAYRRARESDSWAVIPVAEEALRRLEAKRKGTQ